MARTVCLLQLSPALNDVMIAYSRNQKTPVAGALAVHGERVSFAYDRSDQWALRDLSIAVPIGARVGLMGPNGSGKSTLIKAIAGLLKPTHGEIAVLGWPSGSCRKHVSYLPQRTRIDWRFPVVWLSLATRWRTRSYQVW